MTRYGPIDVLWFDFSYPRRIRDGVLTWGGKGRDGWDSPALLDLVRRLPPDILVSDRLDLPGDFVTPEQYQPYASPEAAMWEACQTLNGSWGYDRDDVDYKPIDLLVRMLVDTVAKGGNLLLNVGPNGRGEVDERSLESLRGIGSGCGFTRGRRSEFVYRSSGLPLHPTRRSALPAFVRLAIPPHPPPRARGTRALRPIP